MDIYLSANMFQYRISGIKISDVYSRTGFNYNFSGNVNFKVNSKLKFRIDTQYRSETITAQGFNTDLFLLHAGANYQVNIQWAVGLLFQNVFNTNIQSIQTMGDHFNSFIEYTVYDRILNLSIQYKFNERERKSKSIKTEYGERDF